MHVSFRRITRSCSLVHCSFLCAHGAPSSRNLWLPQGGCLCASRDWTSVWRAGELHGCLWASRVSPLYWTYGEIREYIYRMNICIGWFAIPLPCERCAEIRFCWTVHVRCTCTTDCIYDRRATMSTTSEHTIMWKMRNFTYSHWQQVKQFLREELDGRVTKAYRWLRLFFTFFQFLTLRWFIGRTPPRVSNPREQLCRRQSAGDALVLLNCRYVHSRLSSS